MNLMGMVDMAISFDTGCLFSGLPSISPSTHMINFHDDLVLIIDAQ